jgi:hypothetical protein
VAFDRFGIEAAEVRNDRLDDVADALACLVSMDDTAVMETLLADERKGIVVERQEDPVVLDDERELFSVGIARSVVLANGVYLPAALAKAIRDGNLDVLVAVDRPRHTEAGSDDAERNSSMWS